MNNYILEYKEAGGNFYQIDTNLNSSSSYDAKIHFLLRALLAKQPLVADWQREQESLSWRTSYSYTAPSAPCWPGDRGDAQLRKMEKGKVLYDSILD